MLGVRQPRILEGFWPEEGQVSHLLGGRLLVGRFGAKVRGLLHHGELEQWTRHAHGKRKKAGRAGVWDLRVWSELGIQLQV